MTISVLISSYNYRNYVIEAVESALAQVPAPLEVIVVDDGSTDGSVELLQRHYAEQNKVRIIATQNGGQLAAFVTAYRACAGSIIAFLDADDRFKPGYLARLNRLYAELPLIDQVFCNVEKFGEKQGLWSRLPEGDWGIAALQVWTRFHFYGVPTSGISLRRPLCSRILSLPESFYPDWRTRADDCLVYGGAILGAHRYFVSQPLVDYRVHNQNAWMGRPSLPVEALRFRMRMSRLLDWYAATAGLNRRMLRWSVFEFKTKPRRRFGELLSYLWLQSLAVMPFTLKLRAYGALFKHYLHGLTIRQAGR